MATTLDTFALTSESSPSSTSASPRRKRQPYNSIVAFNDRKGHIYLGTLDSSTVAFLKPHRYGLELTIRKPGQIASLKRYVIPGEVPKAKAVSFITDVVPQRYWRNADNHKYVDRPWIKGDRPEKSISVNRLSHEVDISRALDDSGFWGQRGRMDPKKKIPKAFFTKYPVEELARGRHCSIQAWWKDYLARAKFGEGVGLATYEYPGGQPLRSDVLGMRGERQRHDEDDELDHNLAPPEGEKNKLHSAQAAVRVHKYSQFIENRRNVAALIDLGLVPESPTSVRRFDKIPLHRLKQYIEKDVHRSKAFGRFTSAVAPTFHHVLVVHGWLSARAEDAPIFEKLVGQLEKLPKSPRAAEALERAINAGVSRESFGNITNISINRLDELTALSLEVRRLDRGYQRVTINHNYRPPEVPLDDGWTFADHETFKGLSDKYSICISNVGYYEELMVAGRAHVLYRDDHKTNGGAVAFMEYGDETTRRQMVWGGDKPAGWVVAEIRGFANQQAHEKYVREASIAAKVLTKTLDGPSPKVAQLDGKQRDASLLNVLARIQAIVPQVDRDEPVQATSLRAEAKELQAKRASQPAAQSARRR